LKGAGALALVAGLARFGPPRALAAGSLTQINFGTATGPAQRLTWRVVRDTAQPAGSGDVLERALGFLVANRGDLVITNGGGETYVSKGASFFVPEADLERQESAGGDAVSYVRFGLVDPAEATFTAGGELVYGSEIQQFEGNGWFDLRLYRGDLSGGGSVMLPPTPPHGKVIYAERGSIAVIGVAADGSPTGQRQDLIPGEAWVPMVANDPPDHWEVIVAGEVEHVTFFVAAAVPTGGGDPPGTGGDPGPQDPDGEGSVEVTLYGCSQSEGSASPSTCDVWPGKVSIELESFESGLLFTLGDAESNGDGGYLFRVPFGNYIVRADVLTGELLRAIHVNGNFVQNPTVAVNANHEHSIVEVFFSYA
jgi:hypothetical protein